MAFLYTLDLCKVFAVPLCVSSGFCNQIEKRVDLVFENSAKIADRADTVTKVEVDEALLVQLGILGAEGFRELMGGLNRQWRPLAHFYENVRVFVFLPDQVVILGAFATVSAGVIVLVDLPGEIVVLTVSIPPGFGFALFAIAVHP